MKKLLVVLFLIAGFIGFAQGTIPAYPNLKLTKLSVGNKQDSVVVLTANKTLKQLPTSAIKGTTNLNYVATPTGGIVISSTGNDATVPLATGVNAGLLDPADKVKINNLNTKEDKANKNTANGYAGLGIDGKLISAQLPSIVLTDTYVTASQAEMLALAAETGDVAVRTDLKKSFILKGTNPIVLADWQELLTPTSQVTTVFARNGAISAQTGDYSADQITETANRKFQTANQNTFNDATSSIQGQLNSKETSIGTKNTAFNKNFGTTSETIAEGNDLRIKNGQTAYGWGNHDGLYLPLTGGTIIGDLKASGNNLLSGFILDTHPESSPSVTIPYINNDIAYLTSRGGVASATDNIGFVNRNLFDGSPSYTQFNPSAWGNHPEGYVIEITFHKPFLYGNKVGVSFGSPQWRSKYVKIEMYNSTTSSYITFLETSNNSKPIVQVSVDPAVGGQAFTKMRMTFNDFAIANDFRITEIWLLNYNGNGAKETLLGRDGGTLYGNLTAPAFIGSLTGNATTATALQTGRTIRITGDLNYTSPSFNGSSNVTENATLSTVNSNVGTFGNTSNVAQTTVNAKGLTTAVANVPIQIAESQVTNLVSDLSGKEPSISTKNTAFNKNFGTTAGTVAEGNYPPAKDGTGANGNWGINITGSAYSAIKINSSGNYLTQAGDGTITYQSPVTTDQNGLFPTVDNSNSIISINRHYGDYYSQLGFSSNGNIYYRSFSNTPINTSKPWKQLFDSSNFNPANYLPLTGGTLTGIVTAPTAATGTNTTQVATTAFVQATVSSGTFTPTSQTIAGHTVNFTKSYWTRIGNVVTITLNCSLTVTSAVQYASINVDLPNSFTINGPGLGNIIGTSGLTFYNNAVIVGATSKVTQQGSSTYINQGFTFDGNVSSGTYYSSTVFSILIN